MPQTKQDKRSAAEARQVEYNKLTLEQKLERALTYGSETSKQVVKLRKKVEKAHEKDRRLPESRKPNVKPKKGDK